MVFSFHHLKVDYLISNFYGEPIIIDLSKEMTTIGWEFLIGNYEEKPLTDQFHLKPYESISFIRENN